MSAADVGAAGASLADGAAGAVLGGGGGRAAAAEAWDLGIMKPFSHPGSCLLLLGVRKKHLSCLDWEVSRLSKEVERARVRRNRATKADSLLGMSTCQCLTAVAVYMLSEYDPASTCAWVRRALKRTYGDCDDDQIVACVHKQYMETSLDILARLNLHCDAPLRCRARAIQFLAGLRVVGWVRYMNTVKGVPPTSAAMAGFFIHTCNQYGLRPLALTESLLNSRVDRERGRYLRRWACGFRKKFGVKLRHLRRSSLGEPFGGLLPEGQMRFEVENGHILGGCFWGRKSGTLVVPWYWVLIFGGRFWALCFWLFGLGQACLFWQWAAWLKSKVPAEKTVVWVNVDETSLCLEEGSKGVGNCAPVNRFSVCFKKRSRAAVTLVAVICDRPDLQPLLPQFILSNKHVVSQALLHDLLPHKPHSVTVVRDTTGWTTASKMCMLLDGVADALAGLPVRPVVTFDCCPSHLQKSVLSIARSRGLYLLPVPCKMAPVLQPLDVFGFRSLKGFLAREHQRYQSLHGCVSRKEGLLAAFRACRECLCGKTWRKACRIDWRIC